MALQTQTARREPTMIKIQHTTEMPKHSLGKFKN